MILKVLVLVFQSIHQVKEADCLGVRSGCRADTLENIGPSMQRQSAATRR